MPKEKMKLAYAHENSPTLSTVGGRLTFLRVAQEGEEGDHVTCEACQADIHLAKKPKYTDLFWCNNACYAREPYTGFLPVPKLEDIPARSIVKEKKVCPVCGGPAKGRGFKHEEDCEANKANTGPKSCCAECGGPSHGRGFKHKKGCSEKCQPYVPKTQQADDEEGILS